MSIGASKSAHHNPYGAGVSLPSAETDLPVFWYDYTLNPDTLEEERVPGLDFASYWIEKSRNLSRSLADSRPWEGRFGFSGLYVDCINLGDKNKEIRDWETFWAAASTDQEKIAYATWLANNPEGQMCSILAEVMLRSLVVVEWSSKLPPSRVVPHARTHDVRVPLENNLQVGDFAKGVPVINNRPEGRALKVSLLKERPKIDDLCKLIRDKVDRRGYNTVLGPVDRFVNNPFGINDADETGT